MFNLIYTYNLQPNFKKNGQNTVRLCMHSLYEQKCQLNLTFFFFFVLCNRLYHLISIWANKEGQKVGSAHYTEDEVI